MKRTAILFTALLVLAVAAPLSAQDRKPDVVDEVIRMWKSNVDEQTIIDYVRKADARFRVSADDVIDMADAKVPRTVIKAVLDEADDRGDRSRNYRDPRGERPYYPSYYGPGYSGWYGPTWYYDPWFRSPGVSVGIGFGFGRPYYGRYHGRHWRRRW